MSKVTITVSFDLDDKNAHSTDLQGAQALGAVQSALMRMGCDGNGSGTIESFALNIPVGWTITTDA